MIPSYLICGNSHTWIDRLYIETRPRILVLFTVSNTRSWDSLIFIMGIHLRVRWYLCIEMGHRASSDIIFPSLEWMYVLVVLRKSLCVNMFVNSLVKKLPASFISWKTRFKRTGSVICNAWVVILWVVKHFIIAFVWFFWEIQTATKMMLFNINRHTSLL